MTRFYLTVALAPALLCNQVEGATVPQPYSRIELGRQKCLFAPNNYAAGVKLQSVVCNAYSPSDPRLQFVFDGPEHISTDDVGFENGVYTVQQNDVKRYLDAYVNSNSVEFSEDRTAVTREYQDDTSQQWKFTKLMDGSYTIQQMYNDRYLDAYTSSDFDFRVVTREAQGDSSQRWILTSTDPGTYTIQQQVNNLYMDAYQQANFDFRVVTRENQNNDSQKWNIALFGQKIKIYGNQDYCINVVSGVVGENQPLAMYACNEGTINQRFVWYGGESPRISWPSKYGYVFTELNNIVVLLPWQDHAATQHWVKVDPVLRSCADGATCPALVGAYGGVCSTNVCVEGLCGLSDETPLGEKVVCCGADGIDSTCLNERANLVNGITAGNWCMKCTGHSLTGLTGCSNPIPPPVNNAQLRDGTTHMRCSYDDADDITQPKFVPEGNDPVNMDMTYLALTGREIAFKLAILAEKFTNLKHLDLAASKANGFLFDSNTVNFWTGLEYANASDSTLCSVSVNQNCFHSTLVAMTRLRVLDMSSMGLHVPTKLEPLMSLTSLEELYLNNNNLASLPDNFFENMLKLTKLRMLGNPMSSTLPVEIYNRTISIFDSDVPIGATPDGSITSTPTKSPSEPPPSTSPSLSPSVGPSSAPTFSPTTEFAPTSEPTKSSVTLAPMNGPTESSPAEKTGVFFPIITGLVVGVLAIRLL